MGDNAPLQIRASQLPPEARDFHIVGRTEAKQRVVHFQGDYHFADVVSVWDDANAAVKNTASGERVVFDVSRARTIDGGTMALLVHLRSELKARGVSCEFAGQHDAIADLVHLYHGDVDPGKRRRRRPESALAQVGRATVEFFENIKGVLSFLGDMVLSAIGLLREPKTGNWKEIGHLIEKTGADAVPIVVLINFLVGFVMAFQGAVQLKQFGANIFVADLVGLSITRELGPLMTAIIVCGRSGAAFAAELGTMKVSEEIDALRTLGFGPVRYLVLPRAVALMVALPALTLLADTVAIGGGLLVGHLSLDLTYESYLIETRKALTLWSVASGVVKSVVFAMAIALISCQQGFATSGGAEGVGRRTTSSVVSILFSLILIDAAFTVFFYYFHL